MKPKVINPFIILPSFLIFFFTSCTHDAVTLSDLDSVCFESQVLPLVKTSCGMSGCHDGSVDGFLAQDYASVSEAVSPGDPRGSKLYQVITAVNSENFMPPHQPLTRLQRNIIQVWIEQGARNTKCNQPSDTSQVPVEKKTCFVQDILPMMVSGCAVTGCHDAITHAEGYRFTDYNSIRSSVVPFKPSESKAYQVINTTDEDRMPPAPMPAFTAEQITALRQWITDGAQNSDCPPATCDTAGTIKYSTQIAGILKSNCTGCHNSSLASGNVNLTTYDGVHVTVQTVRNGTPVLLGSVKRMTGFVAMPPSLNLDECSIAAIEKWIAQGAGNQ
jgi:hypothetical protein